MEQLGWTRCCRRMASGCRHREPLECLVNRRWWATLVAFRSSTQNYLSFDCFHHSCNCTINV
uniref:Uncharacterized protein n=1 Tax=Anopheles atroparvus TaxID=41427 RepID=A0AAG5DBT9_ANOAO